MRVTLKRVIKKFWREREREREATLFEPTHVFFEVFFPFFKDHKAMAFFLLLKLLCLGVLG